MLRSHSAGARVKRAISTARAPSQEPTSTQKTHRNRSAGNQRECEDQADHECQGSQRSPRWPSTIDEQHVGLPDSIKPELPCQCLGRLAGPVRRADLRVEQHQSPLLGPPEVEVGVFGYPRRKGPVAADGDEVAPSKRSQIDGVGRLSLNGMVELARSYGQRGGHGQSYRVSEWRKTLRSQAPADGDGIGGEEGFHRPAHVVGRVARMGVDPHQDPGRGKSPRPG